MSKHVLAITGIIGSGKSFAARIFAESGWRTLDADRLCHELYADPEGPLTRRVAETFGQSVLNEWGAVDRTALGRMVLNDPEALARLTGILYPELFRRLAEEIAAARASGERLLLEIPLLGEVDLPLDLDGTVVVWADREVRHRRLKEERHYPEEEIRRREALQMPAEKKLEFCRYALINNGREEFLREQITQLMQRLED